MTLFEAMLATGHIDEDGMVLEDPNSGDGPNTGNGWHGWGVMSCISAIRGELSSEEMRHLFKECYSQSAVEGFPGLVHRGPRKKEEKIAHDDLIGLCVASKHLDGGLVALWAYHHLKKYFGTYDNLKPGAWSFRSLLVRQPIVLPVVTSCAGVGLGALERSFAVFRLTVNSLSSSPRGRILDWLLYCALSEEKSISVIRAREQWKVGLFKKYPKGMRDVFSSYYGVDHPFVEFGVGC
jgi:hypothetical protein